MTFVVRHDDVLLIVLDWGVRGGGVGGGSTRDDVGEA